MAEGGSLINLDLSGLSEVGKALIERVSDGVGGIAKPWQMKRSAKAKAAVDIIAAETSVKISEIEQRGLERVAREAGRHQNNIESITMKAVSSLEPDARPEKIDDDWISYFFDRCRNVSDDEMQSLWGRILSGEVNNAGSFSRKSIDAVSTLDKRQAMLFSKFCQVVWKGKYLFPIIFDENSGYLSRVGVPFVAIAELEELGFVRTGSTDIYFEIEGQKTIVTYFGQSVEVEKKPEIGRFDTGRVILTEAGKQLAPYCGAEASNDYLEDTLCELRSRGYQVSLPAGKSVDS